VLAHSQASPNVLEVRRRRLRRASQDDAAHCVKVDSCAELLGDAKHSELCSSQVVGLVKGCQHRLISAFVAFVAQEPDFEQRSTNLRLVYISRNAYFGCKQLVAVLSFQKRLKGNQPTSSKKNDSLQRFISKVFDEAVELVEFTEKRGGTIL
jgi:hypothetical protein